MQRCGADTHNVQGAWLHCAGSTSIQVMWRGWEIRDNDTEGRWSGQSFQSGQTFACTEKGVGNIQTSGVALKRVLGEEAAESTTHGAEGDSEC